MTQEPMTDRVVGAYLADSSTASVAHCVAPCDGYIIDAYAVTAVAVTTANTTVTIKINGTAVTGGVITISTSGAAIGKVYQSTSITGLNYVSKGDSIRFDSDGAGSAVVPTQFMAIIRG